MAVGEQFGALGDPTSAFLPNSLMISEPGSGMSQVGFDPYSVAIGFGFSMGLL